MGSMLNKELNVTQRTLALTGSGSSLQQGISRNLFSNYSQGENNMAYTANQEAALNSAAPITSTIAEAFAAEFGVSKRSVISKAVTLKIYQKDAPRARSAAKPTKADVVAEIGEALNAGDLSGLEGATMRSLYALLESIG
jgi:uncharacterized glyoxalase superfamily metalloenzyme YdcJ